MTRKWGLWVASVLLGATATASAAVISVAPLHRTTPVEFESEILPMLKQSCLACHNQTKAKADLILETPQTILKGGESGPAVVSGKPQESLLMDAASHLKKPFMPPADNKVNAADLTPEQLALLKLWIEQGAVGEVRGEQSIAWRSLSETVRPILSAAVTADGQFAACGKGNEIFIYQLPTHRTVGPLVDPDLLRSSAGGSSAAHLDLVESLDFSPDGELLASGSYREVKLWRREHLPAETRSPERRETNSEEGPAVAFSREAQLFAVAGGDQIIRLWSQDGQKLIRELKGEHSTTYHLAQVQRAFARSSNYVVYRQAMVEQAQKARVTQVERVRKASELAGVAEKAMTDEQTQLNKAKDEEAVAGKELAAAQTKLKEAETKAAQAQADVQKLKSAIKTAAAETLEAKLEELAAAVVQGSEATNRLTAFKSETEKADKAAQEKIKSIQKRITEAEAALKRMQLTNSAAENELHFAITAAQTTFDDVSSAQNNLQLAETDRKQNGLQMELAQNAVTKAIGVSRALAFSADGQILAAASDQKTVTLWNVGSGESLETISVGYIATGLRFEKAERLVCTSEERGSAWTISPTWKLEKVITMGNGQPAFADRVNAVRFSADGQFLATGGGEPSRSGEVKIWRVKDGQLAQEFKGLHSDTVLTLDYSPDGRYLATGAADRFAKITDLATGRVLRVLEGHTHHVLALNWKADGHTLATAGGDNLIKIWDAFSVEKKKGPEAFSKEVTAVSYMGETDHLLASCGDGTLREIKENGESIRNFEGSSGYLQAAVSTADSRLVLAGGQDGVMRVWESANGKLVSEYR